jgi:hypothetical protein
MKKLLLLIPIFLLLTGCEERYRYPCQDPENWDQKQCKKPFCSANGTCPEDLTHYEKNTPNKTIQSQSPVISQCGAMKKGDCK